MKRFLCTVKVEGEGHFPVDMLRYDHCWPASSDDAVSVGSYAMERKTVMVTNIHYVHGNTRKIECSEAFTVDRWRSFGWHVQGTSFTHREI